MKFEQSHLIIHVESLLYKLLLFLSLLLLIDPKAFFGVLFAYYFHVSKLIYELLFRIKSLHFLIFIDLFIAIGLKWIDNCRLIRKIMIGPLKAEKRLSAIHYLNLNYKELII